MTGTVPVTKGRGPLLRGLARPELGAVVAAVVIAVFLATSTDRFASTAGIATILDVTAPLGIAAVAFALLLIGGEIDFSVGAVAASSALVPGLLVDRLEVNLWEGLGWGLLLALLVGALNGVLVVATRLPGFIVTLGTLFVLGGANVAVTNWLTDSSRVEAVDGAAGYPSAHAVFAGSTEIGDGVFRTGVIWWVALTVVATFLLVRTKFGNWIFGVGGDRVSAYRSGVPVARTIIMLFMGTAAAGWLLGTITLLRVSSVQANGGLVDEFSYIIAAVIGGCLITGGSGSALGAALGALIYGMVSQGMVFAQWDNAWFPVVIGGMLLVAVILNAVVARNRWAGSTRGDPAVGGWGSGWGSSGGGRGGPAAGALAR